MFNMKVHARERMTESKDELARMLGEDELRDAVLLVSQINTQDYHDSGTICVHCTCNWCTDQGNSNQWPNS